MKKKILCLLLWALQKTAFATTYFIAPNGSFTNDGLTTNTPTIFSNVEYKLVPGDVLVFKDGTYNFTQTTYIYQKGGMADYITIKAENKHGAILVGNALANNTNDYGVFYIYGSTKIIVDGLVFTRPAGSLDKGPGIRVSNASQFVTVRNCVSYNNGAGGFTSEGCDNIIFEDNIAHDNCSRNPINTSGFSMYRQQVLNNSTEEYGCIIRRNISYHNYCDLPYVYENESFPTPTDGNGIIIDYFDNAPGNTPYAKKTLVENNVCFDNGGKGIQVYKSSKVAVINNTTYHNNFILDKYVDLNNPSSFTTEIGVIEPQGVEGTFHEGVYNNVAVADPSMKRPFAMLIEDDLTKVSHNYLVGKAAKITYYQLSESSFPASVNAIKSLSDQTSPKFVNASEDPALANFRLTSTSPLVNAATNTRSPSIDKDFLTRPQGTNKDIGAYEFLEKQKINMPLYVGK
jgi:parallel beta-helix repeat protein